MINKKEKYLRNYLNKDKFKENLSEQQNKVINEYNIIINNNKNNQNSKESSYLKSDKYYYQNKSPDLPKNPEYSSIQNIYKIRLEQTREALNLLSKKKWPEIKICKSVLDLKKNVKI